MSLQATRELLFRIKGRYQKAGKKEKTEILNGFIHATGYWRKHAITVLAASGDSEQLSLIESFAEPSMILKCIRLCPQFGMRQTKSVRRG